MNLSRSHLIALTAISLLILATGCSDRDPTSLPEAQGNVDPLVFDDAFSPDVYPQAFFETHVTALSVDSVFAYPPGVQALDGARSLKVNVPPVGSSLGNYTGGVLTAGQGRDLADFNALTFYARANSPVSLDVAGFGNDNTGTSLYEASRGGIPLTTDWTFVVIPIPNSSRLRSERGLFTLAKDVEPSLPMGFDMYLDEIRYANLDNIVVFRPSLTSAARPYFLGTNVSISGTRTIFQVDGAYVPVDHSPRYFDYVSSDPTVAVVDNGVVRVIGVGESDITATLGETPVLGHIQVTGHQPPAEGAPAPTLPAGDVVSMFSDAYADVLVDTWRADWGGVTTQVEDFTVVGNPAKLYSALNWVGIQFLARNIDASAMTHLHLDVFAPAGTNFKVELGCLPADSSDILMAPNGIVLNSTTTPAFTSGSWCSLDIPLENFDLPESGWDWSALAQMVLSSTDTQLVLVDNVYFHR